jgi:hypothetical protein
MLNSIEKAAQLHIEHRSSESLQVLYKAILSGEFLVPLFADLAKDSARGTDVPVRCVRLPNGEGCLPVFTSVERLLEWKRNGSKYTEMPSRMLFEMVSAMPEVDCVFVNYSEQKGAPKGKLTRREFELLARGITPEGATND